MEGKCNGPGIEPGTECGRRGKLRKGLCAAHYMQQYDGRPLSPIGSTRTRNYATEAEAELIRSKHARLVAEGYEPKVLRSEKKTCPREVDPDGDLRCQGVSIDGVRVIEGHDAPVTEFGHTQRNCDQGSVRCRDGRCRRCVGFRNALRGALQHFRNENLTDREIRERTPEKKCGACKTVKPSVEFYVNRRRLDGLLSRCSPCQGEAKRRTMLPETGRAGARRYRARKAGAACVPYTEADLVALWGPRDTWRCVYCDGDAEHLDHVIPLARGGPDALWNLAPACAHHNTSKGAKPFGTWSDPFLSGIGVERFEDGSLEIRLYRKTRDELLAEDLIPINAMTTRGELSEH